MYVIINIDLNRLQKSDCKKPKTVTQTGSKSFLENPVLSVSQAGQHHYQNVTSW